MFEIQENIGHVIFVFYTSLMGYIFWPALLRPELNREKEYYYKEAKIRLRKIFPRWIISNFAVFIFYQFVLNDLLISFFVWAILSAIVFPGVYYQAIIYDMRSTFSSKE